MLASIKQKLKQFAANVDGNIGMMMGLSAIPIVLATGSAIDYSHYMTVRQQAIVALDNAVLAAVSAIYNDEDITDADIAAAKAAALAQFNVNMADTPDVSYSPPVFTYVPEQIGFKGTLTGTVDNAFMSLAGIDNLGLNLSSEALAGSELKVGSDVEVAMMLDTTGSMCDDPSGSQNCSTDRKIGALKTAANLLIDEVVWADQTKNTSKVALVPFSNRVRLAADGAADARFTAVTNLPAVWSGYIRGTETYQELETYEVEVEYCVRWRRNRPRTDANCTEWDTRTETRERLVTRTRYTGVYREDFAKARPCITERYYNATSSFDLTDDAPGPGKWLNGDSGTRRLESEDSSDTEITANGKTKPNYISPNNNGNYSTLSGNYGSSGACSTIHNNNVVMPLTSDITALKARVNDLRASGGTSGALGTAVAWYAISPNWATIWGGDSAPQSYAKMIEKNAGGKPKLYKVAVLMTDGEYNNARASGWTTSTVNNAANALCSSMKAKGIEIYTVGFETSEAAEDLLKDCATDEDHFYSATGAEALQQAFKEIGQRVRSTAGGEVRIAR
jgi:Flp pilus assembly protein TadG